MPDSPLASRFAQTPAPLRVPLLTDYIVGQLCKALFIENDAAVVHAHSRFAALGIDSKRALALKEDLEEALGQMLSVTLLFDYPTPERLATHLVDTMSAITDAKESEPTRDAPDDGLESRLRDTFHKYGV